jgi:hypothetical protein
MRTGSSGLLIGPCRPLRDYGEALSSDSHQNAMRRVVSFLATCVVAVGCGSRPATRTPARPEQREPAPINRVSSHTVSRVSQQTVHCPSRTSDTQIGTQEVKAGTALVFTTPERIRTLRGRVALLTVPAELRGVSPRLDNIHGGVRLIFETEAQAELDALRRNVHAHARELAHTCGLVFVGPVDAHARQTQEEEPPPAPRAAEKTDTKVSKKEEPKKPSDSKVEKSQSDEQPRDTHKDKPKPTKPEKRKETGKPAIPDTPKKDPKPSLPRLPGVRPEPLPK